MREEITVALRKWIECVTELEKLKREKRLLEDREKDLQRSAGIVAETLMKTCGDNRPVRTIDIDQTLVEVTTTSVRIVEVERV